MTIDANILLKWIDEAINRVFCAQVRGDDPIEALKELREEAVRKTSEPALHDVGK